MSSETASRSRLSPAILAAAAVAVLLILTASFTLQIAKTEQVVIPPYRADSMIMLSGQTMLSQEIIAIPGTYRGLTLYSLASHLRHPYPAVIITDDNDHILSESYAVSTSYIPDLHDTLRLEIQTKPFTIETPTHLTINVSLARGASLPMLVSRGNKDIYGTGKLILNGQPTRQDMPLSLLRSSLLPPAARQGIVGALILILSLTLLPLFSKSRTRSLAAGAILALAAFFSLAGYWFSDGPFGIADWDYYFSVHHNYRTTLLQHHELPMWNPYICGGTAGLADPESPFFTPTFLLELLFGIPAGLRLAIYFATIIGAWGMLALARRFGLSVYAGIAAALPFALGTVNLLEVTEGHVNIFAAMWIPWIFWSWYSAYRTASQRSRASRTPFAALQHFFERPLRASGHGSPAAGESELEGQLVSSPGKRAKRKEGAGRRHTNLWVLLTGIFLALTFFQGGIYLLSYTGIAFLVLFFLVSRPMQAIKITLAATLWALGLSAIKLIPTLFWLSEFPDPSYTPSAFTLPYLFEILLGRHLHGIYIISDQNSGWHEYGAYIGYTIFALALIGISRFKKSRLIRGLGIATLLAALISTVGPALMPIFDYLWFIPRSNVSRIILFAVIPIGLLAGFGFDRLFSLFASRRSLQPSWIQLGRLIVIALASIEILSLSSQVATQAFTQPKVYPALSPAPAPIAFTAQRFDLQGQGSRTTRTYAATKAGYGTMAYCSVLGPSPAVTTIHDEDGARYLWSSVPSATTELVSWTPNHAQVKVEATEPAEIALNTNFAVGWTVNGQSADRINNRVGVRLPPGSHMLDFTYASPGLKIGLIITTCTFALMLAYLLLMTFRKRPRSL